MFVIEHVWIFVVATTVELNSPNPSFSSSVVPNYKNA